MLSLLFIRHGLTIDAIAGLGKFDASSMDDQTRMELLVSDIKNLQNLKSKDASFRPISDWPGLTLAADGTVEKIDMSFMIGMSLFYSDDEDYIIGPKGNIDFKWLPTGVTLVTMRELELCGTVDTESLPRGLQRLDIAENILEGEFRTCGLPEGLRVLFVECNKFVGSFDLAHIPKQILEINARENRFSGSVDFSAIPPFLGYLNLKNNEFSGSIDLSKIPAGLRELGLSLNDFSQPTLVVRKPTADSSRILLDYSKFERIIDLEGNDATSFIIDERY